MFAIRARWIEKFANQGGAICSTGAARTQAGGQRAFRNLYDDLYFTEQPYGLVCGFETGLPANDSSSAALT